MTVDVVTELRDRLSAALRQAMIQRDREATNTLRCLMAALDNAGAVVQPRPAGVLTPSPTEVPRRRLGRQDVLELLQAEIRAREAAARDYEQAGDSMEAGKLRDSAKLIGSWAASLA